MIYYFEYLDNNQEMQEFTTSSFEEASKVAKKYGCAKFRSSEGGEYFV